MATPTTESARFAGYAPQARNMAAASPNAIPFTIGAVISFFLFSRSSEFLDTRGRFHLVSILVMLGIFALLKAGTIPKTMAAGPGIWLASFTAWLIFSLPFSSWKGGSFANLSGTWLKSVLFFVLIGGLIFTVEQVRKLTLWFAMASLAVMFWTYKTGANSVDERFSVTYGTLGNSNDLAGSLLMGVPFLTYVILDKRRNFFLRAFCAIAMLALLVMVVRTGSRGGLLAAICLAVLVFMKTNMTNKVTILVLCVLAVGAFPFVVPKTLIDRYATIVKDEAPGASADVASAVESTNARRELMRQGVRLTIRHPLFGVGLGQFSNQSADLFIARGEKPMWFTCHDIFLLVSSETGLPGFLFYMACVFSCYRILIRLQRQGKGNPAFPEISGLAFTVMASLTAFLICGIFSTNAYSFQLPMLAALTVGLDRVARSAVADGTGAALASPQMLSIAAPRFRPRLAPPRALA